ncbi:hypothetical protein PIB30_094653 [Stylosanthes scabra]|uniref:Uncharacterized protein n=1 Tax=Stylosanthes scabra TaxID=79078 RepID=A0ABU6TV36_9FABA|nr:hypothetical protein [Stylosanthes scabra]
MEVHTVTAMMTQLTAMNKKLEKLEVSAIVACMQGNRDKQAIDFDSEIERTLKKLKKKAKQQVMNQVIEEVEQNNMVAVDGNEQRRMLGDYTIPSTASCGSSIVRPNVEANNFELKPSLIQ